MPQRSASESEPDTLPRSAASVVPTTAIERDPAHPGMKGQNGRVHADDVNTELSRGLFTSADEARSKGSSRKGDRDGRRRPVIEHLLRRAGFGASSAELAAYSQSVVRGRPSIGSSTTTPIPDTVDANIGKPGFVGTTSRGAVLAEHGRRRRAAAVAVPDGALRPAAPGEDDALLAQLLRDRPVEGHRRRSSPQNGTRLMAAKASEDPAKQQGQIELLRDNALGNFRDLLVAVAQDPAMLIWLDGDTNTKAKPQENFGRELMELFSRGVGYYTEDDVYAAARVFTGWNLRSSGATAGPDDVVQLRLQREPARDGAKTFSFPIYSDGSRTIPSRAASAGMQDGLDLINALVDASGDRAPPGDEAVRASSSARRRRPIPAFIDQLATVYLQNGTAIKPVLQRLFTSPQFQDPAIFFTRYSWPAEFVVRSLKETGWTGFSVGSDADAARQHGAGAARAAERRRLGARAELVFDRRDAGAHEFRVDAGAESEIQAGDRGGAVARSSSQAVVDYLLTRLTVDRRQRRLQRSASRTPRAGAAWTGSDAQLQTKAPGLVAPDSRISGVSVRVAVRLRARQRPMSMTRRDFVKNGVAAFTFSFAAPAFLSDLARAQGASSRNLVVLDLTGGNDGLSMLVPYTDAFYYSRRPTLAIPAGTVLQVGSDSSGKALGLHPKLTGLQRHLQPGTLALIQRVGYENSSRSHFSGTDIWSTANPSQHAPAAAGWAAIWRRCRRRSIRSSPGTRPATRRTRCSRRRCRWRRFRASPATRSAARTRATRRRSSGPPPRASRRTCRSTSRTSRSSARRCRRRWRRSIASRRSARTSRRVAYPNNGFGQALQAVAGAMAKGIGTKVFWVQTGGFDTHAVAGHERRHRRVREADGRRSTTA